MADRDLDRALDRAGQLLARSSSLVVSTGAGISKESGIPTFRDAPNSLWANFDPEKFASREGFLANPAAVWNWYQERRRMISAAHPNAGHIALAQMEELFAEFYLITQNIDDLHRQAGSRNVIELHGNIYRYKCLDHEHPIDRLPAHEQVPPRCPCGSMIRPDVVWFGEPLPEEALRRAYHAIKRCTAMLVVGTSGTVYPAASFPALAKSGGAVVVEINVEESAVTVEADVFLPGKAGQILPALFERVDRAKSS